MSNQNNKQKINSFKLSSSFNQLYSSKKQQTEQFIKQITQKSNQKITKQQQKSLIKSSNTNLTTKSLFKLNTASQSLLSDIPIDYIKKKSQSRLESINDSEQKTVKFSLLQKSNQNEKKQLISKDRKELLKKYNIDLNAVMSQQTTGKSSVIMQKQMQIQEQEAESIVKPSELYSTKIQFSDPFVTPTVFQTPLLPCFASQFTMNPQFASLASKSIKQGQGVWKIGKIKIRKNRAILKIGEIQYESGYINSEGKLVGVKQNMLYKTQNWNGIWVFQPTDVI